MTTRLAAEATDPGAGMTLGELAYLVERARRLGYGDTAVVRAQVRGWRGRLVRVDLIEPDQP